MSASFPAALADDARLKVAKNRCLTALSVGIDDSVLIFNVANGAVIENNSLITIDDEIIAVASVAVNTVTASARGVDGTSAASHNAAALVYGYVTAWHHNAMREEMIAVQTALGINLANVPTVASVTAKAAKGANSDITSLSGLSTPLSVAQGGSGIGTLTGILQGNGGSAFSAVAAASQRQYLRRKPNVTGTVYEFASDPEIVSSDYDFPAQSIAQSLSIGNNTITLTPVPLGVNWNDASHYLYIVDAVSGDEAVSIVSAGPGTATTGAASGTVTITCTKNHTSGNWTIKSATAGIQEAIGVLSAGGGTVVIPAGTYLTYAPITISGDQVAITGTGYGSIIDPRFDTANGVFDFSPSAGTGERNFIGNLWIYSQHSSHADRIGVRVNTQNTFTAENVYVSVTNIGFQVEGATSYMVRFVSCAVNALTATTGVGFNLLSGSGIHLIGNIASGIVGSNSLAGFRVKNCGGVSLTDNETLQAGDGLRIDPGNGESVDWLCSTGNEFDTGAGRGIHIVPSGTGIVKGAQFVGDWTGSNSESGVEISNAGTIDGVEFIDHRSDNNTKHGYYLWPNPINVRFVNCQAAGNSAGSAGSYHGLTIAAAASKFSVQGGLYGQVDQLGATQGYGILIDAGASDYYSIVGANLLGNASGALGDAGTGIHRIVKDNSGVDDAAILVVASATTISVATYDRPVYSITGTTTITTINGGWIGRKIRLIKTDAGSVTVGGGGNVPLTHTLAQNASLDLVFDGTNWY